MSAAAFKLFREVDLRSRIAGRDRAVSWLELFFDLAFVAGISQIGIPFVEDYSPQGLLRYAFLFFLIWWAWLGHTMYSTRFENDDLTQRLLTFIQIFAVAVMAANARATLGSEDSAGFVAAYALMRVILSLQYLRARKIPETHRLAIIYASGIGAAALLWIASATVPAPARFWIWSVALLVEFGTPAIASRHSRRLLPDAAHLPERFGLFTIILLGESVAQVMRGIEAQPSWTLETVSSAVLSLALVFACWWWYFETAAGAEKRSISSRPERLAFQIWRYSHFPLYLGIAAAGVGLQHLISMAHSLMLSRIDVLMVMTSGVVMMLALSVITVCSGRDLSWEKVRRSFPLQALVAASGLGICALCFRLPPYFAAASLLLLCLVEIALTYREEAVPPDLAQTEPLLNH
jgi:low temperature requirement protein LtrA